MTPLLNWIRPAAVVGGAILAASTALANPCPLNADETARLPIKTYVTVRSDNVADGCGIDPGGTLEVADTFSVEASAAFGSAAGGTLVAADGAGAAKRPFADMAQLIHRLLSANIGNGGSRLSGRTSCCFIAAIQLFSPYQFRGPGRTDWRPPRMPFSRLAKATFACRVREIGI